MTLVKRYPKLFRFTTIIIVALLVYFGASKNYDMVIETQTSRIEELKVELKSTKHTVTTLNKYVNKLEQHTTTFKLVLPDGTIEERTTSDLASETEVSQSAKMEYEQTIQSEIRKVEDKWSKTISERRSLQVLGGVSSKGNYWGSGSYQVIGPLVIGGSIIIDRELHGPEFLIGVGIEL